MRQGSFVWDYGPLTWRRRGRTGLGFASFAYLSSRWAGRASAVKGPADTLPAWSLRRRRRAELLGFGPLGFYWEGRFHLKNQIYQHHDHHQTQQKHADDQGQQDAHGGPGAGFEEALDLGAMGGEVAEDGADEGAR